MNEIAIVLAGYGVASLLRDLREMYTVLRDIRRLKRNRCVAPVTG